MELEDKGNHPVSPVTHQISAGIHPTGQNIHKWFEGEIFIGVYPSGQKYPRFHRVGAIFHRGADDF